MRLAKEHDIDPTGSMTRLASEPYVQAHAGGGFFTAPLGVDDFSTDDLAGSNWAIDEGARASLAIGSGHLSQVGGDGAYQIPVWAGGPNVPDHARVSAVIQAAPGVVGVGIRNGARRLFTFINYSGAWQFYSWTAGAATAIGPSVAQALAAGDLVEVIRLGNIVMGRVIAGGTGLDKMAPVVYKLTAGDLAAFGPAVACKACLVTLNNGDSFDSLGVYD